jgi:multiple sugar transport system permease protein
VNTPPVTEQPLKRPEASEPVPLQPVPVGPSQPAPRRPYRYQRFALALIAPALAFMVLVHFLPSLAGIYTSLLNLNTFTIRDLFAAPWNGLENFESLLFDDANPVHSGFLDASRNTFFYTALTVAGTVAGGLGFALLLNRTFFGNRVARTLMIVPWVIPTFVVAILWQLMLQSESGIVNKVLVDYTGIVDSNPVWLLGDNSFWALIVPSIWRGLPFAALIFLAGLQAIPRELHDAAAIDGAGAWRRFRFVTLPLLRPLIAIQLLFGVIYSAYQFTLPYLMLGQNPGSSADLLMTLVMRESFSNNLLGYGAAISVLLTLAMLVWVAIWYRGFKRDFEAAAA